MRASNPILIDTASTDEALMAAFAGGERSAFDSLYTRHEASLLRFVRRMLGQRLAGEADEAFREIWLRIVEERDEFAAAGTTWRRWAFRIARGISLERLRLSGRDAVYHAHDEDGDGIEAARMFGRGLLRAEDAADADDAGDGRSEEEDAFWRAAGRRVLGCLEELPDDERAAFLLHQQENFGLDDLAYMLGTDEDGVRSRLRRSLRKLRTCMERYLAVLGAAPVDEDAAGDEALRDVYLEEMLVSAPDMGAVLDWRLGRALLDSAHEALMSADPDFADLDAPSAGGRALRYGALALVLAGVAGGWLWLREPGRKARIESVASVAPAKEAAMPAAGAAPSTAAAGSGPAASNAPSPAAAAAPRAGGDAAARADAAPAAGEGSLIPELKGLFPAKPADAPGDASASTADAAAPRPAAPLGAAGSAVTSSASSAASATQAAQAASAIQVTQAAQAAQTTQAKTAAATMTAAAPGAALPEAASKPLAPLQPAAIQPPAGKAVARVQPEPPAAATSPSADRAAMPAIGQALAQADRTLTAGAASSIRSQTVASAAPGATGASVSPATPGATGAGGTSVASASPAASLPATNARPTAPGVGTPVAAPSAVAGKPAAPSAAGAPNGAAAAAAAATAAAGSPANANANAKSAASSVRTDETPPPTFDALSQWARITITRRDGLTRTLTRAEAGDLNMLLGSAAIAAVGPRPLGGSPEWHATLLRPNGDVLAVLDVSSTQVRWRENGAPAATGVPSGLALAGLREAMSDVVRPAPPPGAPAAPAEGAPHSSAAPSSDAVAAEPVSESTTSASP